MMGFRRLRIRGAAVLLGVALASAGACSNDDGQPVGPGDAGEAPAAGQRATGVSGDPNAAGGAAGNDSTSLGGEVGTGARAPVAGASGDGATPLAGAAGDGAATPLSCEHGAPVVKLPNGREVCDCPAGSWGSRCETGTLQLARGCALKEDHTIVCWGSRELPPAGTFKSISSDGTCAIRDDDTVACWGAGKVGRATPPPGKFGSISTTGDVACGVKLDGTIACWGASYVGTPPPGSFKQVLAGARCAIGMDDLVTCWGNPAMVPPPDTFASIADCACGITTQGDTKCWGDKAPTIELKFKQLSCFTNNLVCGVQSDDSVGCWGIDSYGERDPPAGEFTSVSAALYNACGLKTDGTVACWGMIEPNGGPPSGLFASVSVGFQRAVALKLDGTLEYWDDPNQIGNYPPYPVPTGQFTSVVSTYTEACAVRADGTAECWGVNSQSQWPPLDVDRTLPPWTTPLSKIVLGSQHGCGLAKDHTLLCWGTDYKGDTKPPPGKFDDIVSGYLDNCALAGGVATCWGNNNSGQARPPADILFSSLSLPGNSACGLTRDETIVCWGAPIPGDPSPTTGAFTAISDVCALRKADQSIQCWGNAPAPVPKGPFASLSVGGNLACAIRPSGHLECWGAWGRPSQD